MVDELVIKSTKREEIIDITESLEKILNSSGINEGICSIFVMHTSSAIIINENLDDTIMTDILYTLNEIAPRDGIFKHFQDGNADSHIKASILGVSLNIIIHKSKFLLGTYQRVLFCEFDGPRERKIAIKLIPDKIA